MNFTKILQKMKNHPFVVLNQKSLGVDVRKLKPHFDHLPNDKYLKEIIEHPENKPMSQRSMMSYNIEFDNHGNLIRFHEFYELDSYHSGAVLEYAKIYDQFSEQLVEDQVFKDFLYNSLQLTWHLKKYRKAAVTCHAIRTDLLIQISYHDQLALTSPQGMLQNGVDLEVTTIVNKKNCLGAETQIFDPLKSNCLFEMTLDPGEGYLLEGKDYWSYSTKHEPIKEGEVGVRDIIGFLLSIQD